MLKLLNHKAEGENIFYICFSLYGVVPKILPKTDFKAYKLKHFKDQLEFKKAVLNTDKPLLTFINNNYYSNSYTDTIAAETKLRTLALLDFI